MAITFGPFTQGERKSVITVDGRYINNDAEMRLKGVEQGFGIAPFPDFVYENRWKKEMWFKY